MSSEPRSVSEAGSNESLGSLSGCLLDGDAEQLARQRQVKRRALAISISLQSAVLAALILVPLFSKAERISMTIVTPVPPYSRSKPASRNAEQPPRRQRTAKNTCSFCAPPAIPLNIVMRDKTASSEPADNSIEGLVPALPSGDGLIPLSDSRRGPSQDNIITEIKKPRILKYTHLDPAMLIYRVEPIYPPLARQIHKEGRVELRAIIGTDGTIQSLQVVSGDALFLMSAKDAVQQWRYRPTILDGQPVEIDTFVTVVYTMQH